MYILHFHFILQLIEILLNAIISRLRVIGTLLPRDYCANYVISLFLFVCVFVCFRMLHVFRVPPRDRAPLCTPACPLSHKKKRAEREARMSDAGEHASRMGCVLDEDPEDGKRTVDARKLGVNARERSTQQPPCWSPTSCGLLWKPLRASFEYFHNGKHQL